MDSYSIDQLKPKFPNLNFNWMSELQIITNRIVKDWNFVGGCVRDSLLGIETLDIDINTIALPEEIEIYMAGLNISVVGKRFGTIGVFYKKWKIEITTTREDIRTYGRKADVGFITDFSVDSCRRDFTINALMFNGKILIDYHDGIKHLKEGKVIFINDANLRIQEDYLRILRYIRFLCRFSDSCDYSQYAQTIQTHLSGLKQVSIERIISEIYAMCKNSKISTAVEIMNQLGLSKEVFTTKLNENININWDIDKRMAFIFINLDKKLWKNLPLAKDAKLILELSICRYRDVTMNYAYVWNRFHNNINANIFLDIYNTQNNINLSFNVDGFNLDHELLEQFIDQQKGLASLAMRYLFLTNQQINLENIQSFIAQQH